MEYNQDPTKFSLPKKDGVRQQIMTLGENTIEDTKAMFVVHDSFISFGAAIVNLFNLLGSLWRERSAFPSMLGCLVMVMPFWWLLLIMWETIDNMVWVALILNHFLLIFCVEELLIDFHEFMGAHSGENMAAVVWSTLELYGIENKVCQFPFEHYLHWLMFLRLWRSWWIMQATMTPWWKQLNLGVIKLASNLLLRSPACVVCLIQFILWQSRLVQLWVSCCKCQC